MFKKIAFILLSFSLAFSSFSQSKFNQFDAEGKRQGIWKKYFRNKNIRYTGEFNHGKEMGVFKFYPVTGEKQPIIIKEYTPNTATYSVKYFTKKGALKSKGQMIEKERIGEWFYYYKDGKTLLSKEHYKNGLLDGVSQTYYRNGKLAEITHYTEGKLNGQRIRYSDTGKETENCTYKMGTMHGPAIIYDQKGDVFAKGSYVDGIKSGIWEFNMDGEMVKTTADKIKIKK